MRLLSIACAAALAVAAVFVATDASAQRRGGGSPIVVVNYQRVIAESAIGRDMSAKLQGVAQTIGAEAQALQPEGAAIEAERNRLAGLTRSMTPEQIRAHATYGPAYEALAQRLQAYQVRGQGLQGDLECTQVFALREFERLVTPVVRGVMESRGASVVVDARSVHASSTDADITATVIQQLDQNEATRTIAVARHPVAECQSAGG